MLTKTEISVLDLEFNQSFIALIHVSNTKLYRVSYYQNKYNGNKYFVTVIDNYTPVKGYQEGCQRQEKYLERVALFFYHKWKEYQCKELTADKYQELVCDLNIMSESYNFYIALGDKVPKSFNKGFVFEHLNKFVKKMFLIEEN